MFRQSLCLAGYPVYMNRRSKRDQDHADFGFDVRYVVGNPPRGIGLPINERRMTGRKIPVTPENGPGQQDNPSGNDNLGQVSLTESVVCWQILYPKLRLRAGF